MATRTWNPQVRSLKLGIGLLTAGLGVRRVGKLGWLLLVAVLLVTSCSTTSTREDTALALDNILAGKHRSAQNSARDHFRHPKETLLFFGIRPEMKVLEVWPEPGWYTEVIAPLVREHGQYFAAVIAADPDSRYIAQRLDDFRRKLADDPQLYAGVQVVTFPNGGGDVVAPGTLDMVVTFRNIHNWLARDSAPQAFAAMYRSLKPGGVLGVVEHRGNPTATQDPQAKSGYVNEDFAIHLIESQGFKLVGRSEVNANPQDTKDYEQGVWTLPPTYRLGARDRDRYAQIGESDRFTLKFVKPGKS